jgi:hypothetical protein
MMINATSIIIHLFLNDITLTFNEKLIIYINVY